MPSTAMTVADFAQPAQGPGGPRAAGRLDHRADLHQSLRRHRQDHAPFDTPNGLVAPGQDMARRQADLGVPGPAPAAEADRSRTSSPSGAYFANYSQDNHWFFTQILTDVRDNPRFLDAVVTPPGGTPEGVTKNGFRELPVRLRQRLRPGVASSRACWAAKSRSPSGSAPTSAAASSTTTSCRARRTRRPSTWTATRPRRSTTRPSATTASATSTRASPTGPASLGLNYRLTDESLALRLGVARLQDAGARRVPERDGGGAGGPVRLARGASRSRAE